MDQDDFYVGYFSLPQKHKKFLMLFLPSLAMGLLVLSFFMAQAQQTPKNGIGWDPTGYRAIELQGVITQNPYDLLRFREKKGEPIQTAIVTSMVKSSITERIQDLYGQALNLKGVMIRQEGHFVFSVLNGEGAIKKSNFDTSEFINVNVLEEKKEAVTLRGEIIDPKCYIGAMKPGGGKVHKSCAVLCIRGGIPPMFVTRDELMQETYYLITDDKGEALIEPIIPYVGDPIEVKGYKEKRGDILVLNINPQNIKRL